MVANKLIGTVAIIEARVEIFCQGRLRRNVSSLIRGIEHFRVLLYSGSCITLRLQPPNSLEISIRHGGSVVLETLNPAARNFSAKISTSTLVADEALADK